MSSDPVKQFRRKLDAFVFFHLGSDAKVEFLELAEGLKTSLQHPRINPLQFTLAPGELQELARDEAAFEEFMLDRLTENRRGGWDG